MGCPRCTHDQTITPAPPARAGLLAGLGSTVAPAAALVLMPKCPACVAGYVALATGVGVSVTTASYLRWAAIGLCVAWLGFVALRVARRLLG